MLWKFGQGRCCCIHWQLVCWCSGCFVLTSGSSLFRWLKDACCCLYVRHASLTVIYFGVSQNWHHVVHWCAEGKRELVAKASCCCCCSALGLETSFESFPSEYSGSLCSPKWALTILLKAAAEWGKGVPSKGCFSCVECILIPWPYFFLSCFHFICSKALLIKNTNEITGNKPCLHTEIRAVESWRLEESTTITESNHPHHNHCHGLSATSSPFLARAFFPSHSRLWSEFWVNFLYQAPITDKGALQQNLQWMRCWKWSLEDICTCALPLRSLIGCTSKLRGLLLFIFLEIRLKLHTLLSGNKIFWSALEVKQNPLGCYSQKTFRNGKDLFNYRSFARIQVLRVPKLLP